MLSALRVRTSRFLKLRDPTDAPLSLSAQDRSVIDTEPIDRSQGASDHEHRVRCASMPGPFRFHPHRPHHWPGPNQSGRWQSKEPPMANRVSGLNTQCTDGGGTASNQVLDGNPKMVTHCDGGAAGGESCIVTRDNTVCKHESRVGDSGPLGGVISVDPIVVHPATTDTQIVTVDQQVQALPAIQTAP